MRVIRKLFCVALALAGAFSASACSGGGQNTSVVSEYTIKFVNYDDALIYTAKAKEGTIPQFVGNAPTRPSDVQYNYRFSGWNPELHKATKDETYKATYTNAIRSYLVSIDGNLLGYREYGSKLSKPEEPEDELIGDVYKSFDGWVIQGTETFWDFDNDTIKGDTDLVSHYTFTTALNITFKGEGGKVLYETKAGKGLTPKYNGPTPTKNPTIEKEYEFSGWEPALGPVEEDTTYTAKFSEHARKYDIKFYNYDKSLIVTVPTDYGTVPAYTGNTPVRPNDSTYSYKFSGWTPELTEVTGDASYTAVYGKEPLHPVKITINQYIDDNKTPVYTEDIVGADKTVYTVESKYHSILNTEYNPNNYSLKSSDIADIYLIAGQSNAAGYSSVNYLSSGKKEQYSPTPHVTFYGHIDDREITDITTPTYFGLGPSNNHFGAEVGMAKIIEQNNPNGMSTIVKTAYGGSWLYDYRDDNVSKKYGNWCSPSYRTAAADPNITGKCYDNFIADVTSAVNYYKGNGYMVRLSGMIWIQGEQESSQANSSDYGAHLEALISDLRTDFSALFDYNATTAPFVIGKISSTFAGGHLGVDNVRKCEEQVASKMDDVYALETYEIVDPATGEPKKGCYDKYHFAADDMLQIGERAGVLMNEKLVPEGSSTAFNVLRKELNGDTTFDLYFETRQGGSYKIEYYFQSGEEYLKNSFVNTVSSSLENPFYPGDKVTCSTDIPSEITDKPTLPKGCKWEVNKEKSLTTGFVLSEGKLTLKVYYDAVNPYDANNTVTFDENYWKSRSLSGVVGNTTNVSSNNKTISFYGNEWLEYTPNGWGSFVTNGAHWDAYFMNTSVITGIKKIEFQMWWKILYPDSGTDTPYVSITTSSDSAFTQDVTKTYFRRGEGSAATTGEIYTLNVTDLSSYFKFSFGDDSNNWHFSTIMKMTITFCNAEPDNKLVHNSTRQGNTFVATELDGKGWDNFDGSYYYLNSYSNAIIVSANLNFLDHEWRAFSGITLSNGAKLDESKGADDPRNFKSIQIGLAFNGAYSSLDHKGVKGADASSYYPKLSPALGTSAKLTVVLLNDAIHLYINDVYCCAKPIADQYLGSFAAGTRFMVGFWWANYLSSSRTSELIDEIYGRENVATEIATNPVYANLRK